MAENCTVTVRADIAPIARTVNEIAKLLAEAQLSPQVVGDFADKFVELRPYVLEWHSARGASEARISIKPDNRLLKVLAALRAGEGQRALLHLSAPQEAGGM